MLSRFSCYVLALLAAVFCFDVAFASYAITGVDTGVDGNTGARPARRNILDMQNDTPAWSLYIQSLAAMMSDNEGDLTSWFQVAGIHGRPYLPWNNAAHSSGAPTTGYCTHDSVIFLTWHRPYMALYEQVLADYAQNIAKTYTPSLRSTYQTAADNFRVPYWDWASVPQMPDIINTQSVQIVAPSGATQYVSNPLMQYTFQTFPLNPVNFPPTASDGYLAPYRYTVRCPDYLGGPSNPGVCNSHLAAAGLQEKMWDAMVKSTTYNDFATMATFSGVSLETVHGSVHTIVGGAYGHMSQLSYSAFDPIFFLHHANIDRLFAMWQAINPDSYLTNFKDAYGTYTIVPNSIDTLSTPLEPFSSSTVPIYYNSLTVRDISTYGYTYPEIQDWDQSPSELKANVTAHINMLYNPTGAFSKRSLSRKSKRAKAPPGSQVREWSAKLLVNKFDLNGQRFMIRFFLGEPPEDPSTWATSDAVVGSLAVLPPPGKVGNATTGVRDVLAYDEVSLVRALEDKGCDEDDVDGTVAYLTKELEWRVQGFNDTVIPTEMLSSLNIMVQDEIVTLARDIFELPTYGQKTFHPEVTQGKAGGSS